MAISVVDRSLGKKLEEFLEARGATILEPTNHWELARFRTANGVCVIYQNAKRSFSSSNEHAAQALEAFRFDKPWNATAVVKRIKRARVEEELLARDGNNCFFCGRIFSEADPATLEHLLSRSVAGNNHIHNLALAHHSCNQLAKDLSIVAKVLLRDQLRKSQIAAIGEKRNDHDQPSQQPEQE